MSTFLHDLSNIIAIIQGNIGQANKLLASTKKNDETEMIQMKLDKALKEIQRLNVLLKAEKMFIQNKKDGA